MKKDFMGISDLDKNDIRTILRLALQFKTQLKRREDHRYLPGKILAMLFEKPSLRTRVTFECGMVQLGGHAIYLAPSDIGMGKRESVSDVAKSLSRWVDGIVARTFLHSTVRELGMSASAPVINGLSDLEHPCQAIADFQTICEKKAAGTTKLAGLKLAYIGDGNNVCNSLLLASALLEVNVAVGCPRGYEPDPGVLEVARKNADNSSITILNDASEAAKGADVVYTDVWTSMGQESEKEERLKAFAGFQVDTRLMELAMKDAVFMHCMPAHRGEEVSQEVIDGPQSVVFDQAENRLHAQKALLVELLR